MIGEALVESARSSDVMETSASARVQNALQIDRQLRLTARCS
jgi:hypothetical protein